MKNYLKTALLSLSVVCLFSLTSCYYDNVEELYPTLKEPCSGVNFDTISYSKNIVPIMNANCTSCHGATYMSDGGKTKLDTYDDITADLEGLIISIKHTGKKPMPKNSAKLLDCEIKQFENWFAQGSPNN